MMLSRPNHPLRLRHTGGGSHEQSRVKRAQIESAVESIGERGQVSRSIFAEVERMVTAAQTGLEVTEYGVDPLELGQVLRLALADNGRLMRTTCTAHRAETGQSIGEHSAARGQMCFGPLADCDQVETRDRSEFDAQGVALVTEGDGGDERDLVLRAPADFATAALAAQVGIIDLDLAIEHVTRLTIGHRLHQLVVDEPSGRIAHPEVALECERRQSGLGLADQVDREEPGRQRQFGALHHGAGDQRRLMSTRLALEQRVGSPAYPAVSNAITARTPKPRRPACLLQSRLAGWLGSVALEKLGHGQSGLKLDSVHRHGTPLSGKAVSLYSIDLLGCLAEHRC